MRVSRICLAAMSPGGTFMRSCGDRESPRDPRSRRVNSLSIGGDDRQKRPPVSAAQRFVICAFCVPGAVGVWMTKIAIEGQAAVGLWKCASWEVGLSSSGGRRTPGHVGKWAGSVLAG